MNHVKISEYLRVVKVSKIKLVPFALMAAIISGCSVEQEEIKNPIPVIEETVDNEKKENEEEKTENLPIGYYLSNWGYACGELKEDTYIINKDVNQDKVYCYNLDDFRNYVENKHPTFDEVKEAVIQNENINGKYQEWLLAGLDNLEQNENNLDLVVLYQNIRRLQIIEKSGDEIYNEERAKAYFEPSSSSVTLDKENISNQEFCHEVLGHGATEIALKQGNQTIVSSLEVKTLFIDIENQIYKEDSFGSAFREAAADMISGVASGGYLTTSYNLYVEQLRIYSSFLDYNLSDYISGGPLGLIEEMKKIEIQNPYSYIQAADKILNTMDIKGVEEIYSSQYNLKKFILEYAEYEMKNGIEMEDVKEKVESVIDENGPQNIHAGGLMFIDYLSSEDLKEDVIDALDNLNIEKNASSLK